MPPISFRVLVLILAVVPLPFFPRCFASNYSRRHNDDGTDGEMHVFSCSARARIRFAEDHNSVCNFKLDKDAEEE